MNADLVHSTRYGQTFYQGVFLVGFERKKNGFGNLAFFAVNLHGRAIFYGANGQINRNTVEIVYAIHHRVVAFGNFAVFKLHRKVAVGFGVFGNGQHARRFFVQTVGYLRVKRIFFGHSQDTHRLIGRALVDGWNGSGLADNDKIFVFKQNKVFKIDFHSRKDSGIGVKKVLTPKS